MRKSVPSTLGLTRSAKRDTSVSISVILCQAECSGSFGSIEIVFQDNSGLVFFQYPVYSSSGLNVVLAVQTASSISSSCNSGSGYVVKRVVEESSSLKRNEDRKKFIFLVNVLDPSKNTLIESNWNWF